MGMGLRLACVLGFGAGFMAPVPAYGQFNGVVLSISSGLNVAGPSSRFNGTDPGYVVEGSLGVALSDTWQVGAGGEWGTFGAEVPEFAVFAPLDHAPWLEYTMLYGRARRILGSPAASTRPFLDARLGWVRELAEFSGAEVRRGGLATGGSVGFAWDASSRVSLHMTGTVVAAFLGSGRLRGVGGPAPGSLASYGKLSGGVILRLGG